MDPRFVSKTWGELLLLLLVQVLVGTLRLSHFAPPFPTV